MKAIILAAGQGARLRPLTDDRPKCMVAYQGKPLIEHVVRALRVNAITDIVAVRGYKPEALRCAGVRFYDNPRYASTNMVSTLFCAERELDGDVIISYSDIVYTPSVIQRLLATDAEFAVVIDRDWRRLWQERMDDPLDDAETLRLDRDGRILELGKKARSYEDIEGQYIGLLKVAASAWPKLRAFYHRLDRHGVYDGKDFDNMYMTSFVQAVIDRLMPVTAVPIQGGWLEIDVPSDLSISVDLS
ncbi:MAG TPA: phosphocholine cytidylyltransferase family protein [Polyangiaceae bacterium]|nr:phosphocholine cytidylyltransferase family protein [Polyangiaceae bacterium]